MPIYEYKCTVCGYRFEVHRTRYDPTLPTCPNCDSEVEKVYSPVGIVFKGSGFYSTEYKKSSNTSESSDESKGE
jgi:putative FmdB family regulatory protein